ncbi:MAG TPA: orotate phosphoribosyltransferase [bacterium]|nr:orotate phosphoribosyltransferase [bacterium]
MSSNKIAKVLLKLGAVALRPSKPYVWASGIRSPIYCDNRLLLSHPKERDRVMEGFLKLVKNFKFDAVAGIATAGIPHAAILADRLGVPMLYVRASPKTHGKGNRIEGQVRKGDRVLVVEDLVSTGQSSLEAVRALRQAGLKADDCVAIFTYGFPFAKNAFQRERCRLHTLTNLQALLDEAEETGRIAPQDRGLIEKFAKNPQNWFSE